MDRPERRRDGVAEAAGRVTVIEGRQTLVVERRPPLPPRLGDLLARLRVYPVRIRGWRSSCSDQDHRMVPLADGSFLCYDGVRRDLRVSICADCEAACVRDVSVDRLVGLPTGRHAPRRRDGVIGWYSGARRNQRTYGMSR
jgi:hypothetical protein